MRTFREKEIIDWRAKSNTANTMEKLTAGKDSKSIIKNACHKRIMVEESENMSEKKVANPETCTSDKNIFTAGTKANSDRIIAAPHSERLRRARVLCFFLISDKIFSSNSADALFARDNVCAILSNNTQEESG